MSASEIRTAVAAARPKLPLLAADYADRAIATGKTLAQVKGDLVDLMSADPRAMGRASMLAEARRQGLMDREPSPEAVATSTSAGALWSRSASLENMRAQVRAAGMVPKC